MPPMQAYLRETGMYSCNDSEDLVQNTAVHCTRSCFQRQTSTTLPPRHWSCGQVVLSTACTHRLCHLHRCAAQHMVCQWQQVSLQHQNSREVRF
jgi:hypothetical protein